eukprot:CAMPEP_0172309236 /NCGR_PEP_ID=MMETSP1058-20130122/9584_1 /TAXON_ID=83371 /ORGANISM="Detonula confervacea, Strain CCMP 353" /LENGTH=457 /DNA_ID=CAMNT_0013021823 /DNA_START=387 /DNA_END=1763 /DNA_ORIENTATION=+
MIKSGAASAKESSSNSGEDLLTTLGSQSKRDNLQSDDAMKDPTPTMITLPLEPASGGTFCVRFTVFASDDASKPRQIFGSRARNLEDSFRVYRAIVDTGSPYLVLPSFGPETKKRRFLEWTKTAYASTQEMEDSLWLSNSEYPSTEEIYGAVKGQINWKLSRYMFRDPRLQIRPNSNGDSQYLSTLPNSNMPNASGVVGVLDDALTNEATGGGMIKPYALLGLIQNSNPNADRNRFPDPRPSFLEQECITTDHGDTSTANEEYQIKSFSINGPLRELTLSTKSMIPATAPAMPLVDLRTVGDFVDHYAVVVDSISFDGISVSSQSLKDFSGSLIDLPIVAVFDTGLTGCLMIRPFWDVMQKHMGAKRATFDEFGSVSLSLRGSEKQKRNHDSSVLCNIRSSIEEDPRFYVQPIDLDWFDDEQYSPYIIVLGQTFLSRGALTIDMDERIATFDRPAVS